MSSHSAEGDDRRELMELIGLLCNGEIDPQRLARLEQ